VPHTSSIVEGLRCLLTYGVERTQIVENPHAGGEALAASASRAAGDRNRPCQQGGGGGNTSDGPKSDQSCVSGTVKGRYTPPHLRGASGAGGGPRGSGWPSSGVGGEPPDGAAPSSRFRGSGGDGTAAESGVSRSSVADRRVAPAFPSVA